ncbi:exo-beta-N-acetylmuramidase NamZ family protein [Phytoactinopolyspora halophila]|uniref:exo-beta-N-acetylmuramidase NamZ family protein n=1 Tax=Phytoactinopolyspora halophila TaxID=1981511 RepID=UPI001B8BF176|nr:DUF1343 domain-containing protein [Phytoactinopolyspora halophila]
MNERTRIGVERLSDVPSLTDGERLGLITNYTGALPDLGRNIEALLASGVPLTALFGPEHGLHGTAQAGASETGARDPESGLPLYDTYQRSGRDLDELVASSGVDCLLFDIQDIGTRFYTYVWTMYDLMVTAARLDLRFVVLDRPNPITGRNPEGPFLDAAYSSFVGRHSIPIRHGLTAGELARYLNRTAVPDDAGRPADLDVVTMSGWQRSMHIDDTGLPWVMPSVNIPTPDTALVYPGTGLFEGTNLSEGRGTTRPFELIGAPYVDGRWAGALNERELPGARFRDVRFTPTFHKHAHELVRGVQVYITDRFQFRPVHTAVVMLHTLAQLYPGDFGWREPTAGGSRAYFIDLLWGSGTLRATIDAGDDPEQTELAGSPRPASPAAWAGDDVLLYHE